MQRKAGTTKKLVYHPVFKNALVGPYAVLKLSPFRTLKVWMKR